MAIRVRRKQKNEQAMAEFRAIAAAPTVDWMQQLERHSMGVAEAMGEIHGGRYNVVVNHETCLVMVVRILEGDSR